MGSYIPVYATDFISCIYEVMGITIDKTIEFFNGLECHTPQAKDARDVAIDVMRKYQMMQAEYENRLRADMVAMLEELRLEFEEYEPKWAENEDQVIASNRTWDDFDDIIRQKIDLLRSKN